MLRCTNYGESRLLLTHGCFNMRILTTTYLYQHFHTLLKGPLIPSDINEAGTLSLCLFHISRFHLWRFVRCKQELARRAWKLDLINSSHSLYLYYKLSKRSLFELIWVIDMY